MVCAAPLADPTAPVRQATMPDGRRLEVRLAGPHDVDRLVALYAALDDDARYRRFFSAYQPDHSFFERMIDPPAGGVALVATVQAREDARPEVVGDASYVLLPNGNGELEVTVDGRWRGWLGAYLLDALVEAARERGVPNLEAELLMTNRAMLALVRSRGFLRIPVDGLTTLRVAIAAAAPLASVPIPAAAVAGGPA